MKSNIRSGKPFHSILLAGGVLVPGLSWAQDPSCGETAGKLNAFLGNITGLLNLGSIAVVTIAIIFAGYQIAFAHKRISDVAPILIGGLLIGAAAQIANMIVGNLDKGDCMVMILNTMAPFYA